MTNKEGKVSQHMEYLPFGETLVDEHVNSNNSPFKFNGKEYDEETGNYYYSARYYDPKLSIFISVDPLVEKTMDAYGYCYQNPVKLVDPTGLRAEEPPSTHIDEKGNVIAVFDDGDNGVYQHKKNADGGTPTEYMLLKRTEKYCTSSGGKKVGETWTSLGFADFGAYSQGIIRPAPGATIDLESNWASEQVAGILDKNPTLFGYALKARGGNDWDIKVHTPNSNIYYGSLLAGKYASARDAGNFTAGAVAQLSIMPNGFSDYGFGTYNLSGNSVSRSLKMISLDVFNYVSNNPSQKAAAQHSMIAKALWGEHPLSRAGIEAGKKFIKNLN